MDYLICTRNKKGKRFGSEPGPTRFLKVPAGAARPLPKHAVTSKVQWVDEVMSHAEPGASAADPSPVGDILFFVHGYNNSPEVVLARQRLLLADLRAHAFDGIAVGFDWPSGSSALNYLEDRSDARRTALQLVSDGLMRFARRQGTGCNVNLHILAHSTGAFVIREAFDDADDTAAIANVSWTVSQMIFIGADVSRRAMCEGDSKSSSIYRHCVRLTNYSNPYDNVLKLSNIKRVGVAPRAAALGCLRTPARKPSMSTAETTFRTSTSAKRPSAPGPTPGTSAIRSSPAISSIRCAATSTATALRRASLTGRAGWR